MYYKMAFITVQNSSNAEVNTITIKNEKLFWVKMSDVEKGLGIKNISDLLRKEMCGIFETKNLTEEQKRKYITTRKETNNEIRNDYKFKFARSDIMERIIKNCRGVKKCNENMDRKDKENQIGNFRLLLRFKENDIFQSKEYSIVTKITTVFLAEEISLQHNVLSYKIDAYFSNHKLAIEIDEGGDIMIGILTKK